MFFVEVLSTSPLGEVMSNPSIGAVGHVELDVANARYKGVIPTLHRDTRSVHTLLKDVTESCTNTRATRLSVRTFVGHGVDPEVSGVRWRGEPLTLEAYVPVPAHTQVAGYAYYGVSLRERRQPMSISEGEHTLFARIRKRGPIIVREHIKPELLNGQTFTEDVEGLLLLYKRYDSYLVALTIDSIRDLIKGSRVMVSRDTCGQIVSVCVGEVMTFHVKGADNPVLFTELSDAATLKTHEGKGFYTATKSALISSLRQEDPNVVITTEGRANSGGVLRSNLGIGMIRAGYQPSHCVISSSSDQAVRQIGPFGNLFVFYVP